MKNLIVLVLLFLPFYIKAQEIVLKFAASYACDYDLLDSILINNLTKGCDTTIYYPDTTLVLYYESNSVNSLSLKEQILKNYPNPFYLNTYIDVSVPKSTTYSILLHDNMGNKILSNNMILNEGINQFLLNVNNYKQYILTIRGENMSKSIKIKSIGDQNKDIPQLKYIGNYLEEKPNYKSTTKGFYFDIGDELAFSGYIRGYNDQLTHSPLSNENYHFDIKNQIPESPTANAHESDEESINWTWLSTNDSVNYIINNTNNIEGAISNGSDTTFIQEGLTSDSIYTLYVWAENSCGHSVPSEFTAKTEKPSFNCGDLFVDPRDSNQYLTVQIGDLCWFAENLKYLPSVSAPETGSDTIPYYYVYGYEGNDTTEAKTSENYTKYGVLYNWSAAMNGEESSNSNPSNVKGVCPQGWHLPSESEWEELNNYLGADPTYLCNNLPSNIAKALAHESGWHTSDSVCSPGYQQELNNTSGFSALPGGLRNSKGFFFSLDITAGWHSTTQHGSYSNFNYNIYYRDSTLNRSASSKSIGKSVRCIKDQNP